MNVPFTGGCACGAVRYVHASSLDDPSQHRPTMDIFTSSAQPWDHMDPDLPKYAKRFG